ncbi:MAG: (2Fe-2S)-binding protein [Pseudonocardia sp.]|nr:(2Fe-2S)-binding protein [Pseudonocardia sp.]
MFVCMCMAVTESEIRACMRAGARTVAEVSERSLAGTGCGGCLETVELIVQGGGLGGATSAVCGYSLSSSV